MSIIEKINWSLLLGVIAGIIVIAVAVAQWSEKKKVEVKSEASRKKAESAQAELKSIQLENLSKTDELANAYKEIANLQKELRSEITGGDSKPVLVLTTSRIVFDNNSQKKYFILFFNIQNNSEYALQNVSAIVRDSYGYQMLQHGVQHGTKHISLPLDMKDWSPTNSFEGIGSIPKGNTYPLYITTYCPELAKNNNPTFPVEINWYNGHFTYYINLKIVDETLDLQSVEFVYNGKKIKYNKYLKFIIADKEKRLTTAVTPNR